MNILQYIYDFFEYFLNQIEEIKNISYYLGTDDNMDNKRNPSVEIEIEPFNIDNYPETKY